jgi:bifunctional DNase/RNase
MTRKEKMVAIEEISLMIGFGSTQAIVLKEDAKAARQLTMFVGQAEYTAIAKEKGLVTSDRPLTHELYLDILKTIPIEFQCIEIYSIKENVFHAKVIFQFKGREYTVDSRPSDALALALNSKIPVMVNEDLLRPVPKEKVMKEYEKYIRRVKF